jgi:hypothetical protein
VVQTTFHVERALGGMDIRPIDDGGLFLTVSMETWREVVVAVMDLIFTDLDVHYTDLPLDQFHRVTNIVAGILWMREGA